MPFYFENRETERFAKIGTSLQPFPHLHNEIEMVLCIDGESLATADLKSAVMQSGDIYIAFPNQIHHYSDRIPPRHIILIFSPDLVSEFQALFDTNIPACPVIKGAANNPRIMDAAEKLVKINTEPHPFSEALARGLLLVILSELFAMMEFEEAPKYDSNILKQVIKYCYDNYSQDISLQSIADSLHVSKYYISHLFGKKLNISFNEYINMLRIKRACSLLTQDTMSVIDIGFSVGYNSIRTFDRCFKDIHGMSPKEYRTEHKNPHRKVFSVDKHL